MKAFFLILQLILIYCVALLITVAGSETMDYSSTFLRASIIAAPIVLIWIVKYQIR